jgi:hypothetical protein
MSSIVYINSFIQKSKLLKNIIPNYNISFNFLNLDIQGAELMALKGGTKAIEHAKVIYLEVNTEEVYKGCALITELDNFLDTYKFKRVITEMTEYGWGDAVYIKTI